MQTEVTDIRDIVLLPQEIQAINQNHYNLLIAMSPAASGGYTYVISQGGRDPDTPFRTIARGFIDADANQETVALFLTTQLGKATSLPTDLQRKVYASLNKRAMSAQTWDMDQVQE